MLDVLALLVSLPAFGLACALWMVAGYQAARRRGYQPPAASAVLFAGACAGVAATVVRHPANSTGFRFFVDFFWITWLWAAVGTAAIVLLLPRRRLRAFGARRRAFPFVRTGQVLVAAALIGVAASVSARLGGSIGSKAFAAAIALAVGFVAPTGRYLVRLGRRAEAEASSDGTAIETLDAPMLYLRAFNQERQFFAIGPASAYRALAKGWHAAVAKPQQNVGVTFEEFFAAAAAARLGPLVALGSPEDYLAPEGAARLYAKDSDWMNHVDLLVRRASAILVEVGASANLQWEFEHIRREGLHEKLFVITRPSTEGAWLSWAFWHLVWRIQGVRAASPGEFARNLARVGYEFGGVDAGPGSVVAFDANARAILLTTNAAWPGEFIAPIRDWIVERRRSGRCVPASCGRCGRRVYAWANVDATPVLCRDCRYGPPLARMWRRSGSLALVPLWLAGVVPIVGLVEWMRSPGSFVDRHDQWIYTPLILAWFAALFWILGHMQDPPPFAEPDTSATPTGPPARHPARAGR